MNVDKDKQFSEWYNRIIREADIIDDRYPIKGMPVYKTYGYRLISYIFKFLEKFLEEEEVYPAWFPVLIPESIFKKESEHIKGFEGEVFWITRGGFSELDEKYILRPTSETEMYYMFKYWINSYSDLPLKIYMTNTVYRYETKATKPLLRGREILWNEAHTAHATKEDAEMMIRQSMRIYSRLFWDIASIPHIWVVRPEWDKFAGADHTWAADTIMPDGRFLQIGTTHLLGQNFAKAFNIKFMDRHPFKKISDNEFIVEDKQGNIVGRFVIDLNNKTIKYNILDKEGSLDFHDEIDSISESNEKLIKLLLNIIEANGYSSNDFNLYKYIWQTSFGISMRFAAAVIGILGDNKGLILPFSISPIQIVIIPIYYGDEKKDLILDFSRKIYNILKSNYRVVLDDRDDKTPGWKFNYWEFLGVPFRIEIGLKDINNNSVTISIRSRNSKAKKVQVSIDELKAKLGDLIDIYDRDLKNYASKYFSSKIVKTKQLLDLKSAINSGKVVKAPFCMKEECANRMKNDMSVEVRGYDYLNPEKAEGDRCIYCGDKAKFWVYIGRSY